MTMVKERMISVIVRGFRFRAVKKYVNGDVLDLGCGAGTFARGIGANQRYVGLDCYPPLLGYYWREKKRYLPKNITFHCCDIENEKIPNGPYSTIIMAAVLEHLSYPSAVISKCANALIKGGRLIITTPSPWATGLYQWLSKLGILSRRAEEEHQKFLNQTEVKTLVADCGFHLIKYSRFILGVNQLFVFEKIK